MRAMSTTRCGPWISPRPSGSAAASPVSEFVLTAAERALLTALEALRIRFLLVGMGAALIEGAAGTTQHIDLWFGRLDETGLREAARRAGGFYTSGLGMQAPTIGGEGLDRVDLVLTASGLESFEDEYARARDYVLDDLRIRVLPLERVIASKRAANRAKDAAQLPLLEAALAAKRNSGRQ